MLIGDPSFAVSAGQRCGSVFEYKSSAGRWHQAARVISPHNPHRPCPAFDSFGYFTALSGRTAIISTAGQAYILTIR